METKLSWNKEYYKDGTWWCVETDKEVDWLSSIHCEDCGYSGELENGGHCEEGLPVVEYYDDPNEEFSIRIYECSICGKKYIEYNDYTPKNNGWLNVYED